MNIIQQILQRLASKDDKFFQKYKVIIMIFVFIVITAFALVKYDIIHIAQDMQEKIEKVLTYIFVAFFGMFFSGSLSTTNPDLVDKETKQNVIQQHFADLSRPAENTDDGKSDTNE